MKQLVDILMLEDVPADAELIEQTLRRGGINANVHRVETRDAFAQALEAEHPDVIVTDHGLPAFDGLGALSMARAKRPDVPVIVVTASPNDEMTRRALQSGATEYVSKDQLWHLVPRVKRAMATAQNQMELAQLRKTLAETVERYEGRLKEVEKASRTMESYYRMAVENAIDYAIYMLDSEGRVASWNLGAERIEGYKAEEIIGKHFSIFFTPEDRQAGRPEEELDRARAHGSSISEAWSVRKDGSRFISRWALNAVREDGQLLGYSRVAHDVTQLREVQKELRWSEELSRLTIEAVQDYAIYLLDASGRVATYNQGATRLEGYEPQEIIGRPLHTFFTPEDVARGVPDQELERAKTEGKSHREGWNVRKDGSRFLSNWVLNAINDEQGTLTGFSKVARDVTELKQAEDKIRSWNVELETRVAQRTRELELANKEMEAFSYSVSHDLRAPLRHINAFIQLLEEALGTTLSDEARGHLHAVADSARHMGRLVDDLLTFSRAGRQEMRRVPIRLLNLVREAQQHLQSEIVQRDTEWVIHELPEVEGDPTTLRQVFINLLSNALKYSASRPRPRIEIGCDASASETICFVRDNGVGFDPRYAHKLFGVFQRLHSPQQFEGTGIGLAIVRRVIERHGGRVWAEGEINQGATFYFSLPKMTPSPKV